MIKLLFIKKQTDTAAMLLISKTILSRNKQTEDRAAVPEKCKMFGKIIKCNIETTSNL